MTSWDLSYGRSCQSAPNSRKASPVLKTSHARTSNASPIRPSGVNSPRGLMSTVNMSSFSVPKERRSRAGTVYNDHVGIRAGDDGHVLKHCRFPEGECLDRNCDSDLKSFYENLLRGKDDIIRKMEKKVDHLHRELSCVRQAKDKEIDVLRQTSESSVRMAECEFERRLNETVAEAEKQKACMHSNHTRRIQELLETTNRRLQKMEESYGERISYLTRMVDELECKLATLCKEMEQSMTAKKHLKDERDRLSCDVVLLQEQNMSYDQRLKEVSAELECTKAKICQLESEKNCLDDTCQKSVDEIRKHLQCEIQYLKEKNMEDELQCNCKITSLEQIICQLKENLKHTEECHAQQIKEVECKHQQHAQCMEHEHKKQVQEMQREIDVLIRDYSTRVKALELCISDKDRQLCQLKSQLQCVNAELEEKNRRFKEMSGQGENEIREKETKIQALCAQLTESTMERERCAEEMCQKLEEQKRQYCEETRELNCKLQQLQRAAELQAEDNMRILEEEKRRCDEKVSKVSEQLKQSICLYEKEANDLMKQIEDERKLRCEQVRDLTEQVQQMKRLLQQQSDEFLCQLEEEKRQFRKQIQDLCKQVEQFRAMCEKQSREYAQQMEDERQLHQEQVTQMRCQCEADQQELIKKHQKELESLKKDPQNYVRCLEDKFTKLLSQAEDKAWDQEQRHLKRITDLECQLQQVHCDGGLRNCSFRKRTLPDSSYDTRCDKDCNHMRMY